MVSAFVFVLVLVFSDVFGMSDGIELELAAMGEGGSDSSAISIRIGSKASSSFVENQ